jgi:hypothetical protein
MSPDRFPSITNNDIHHACALLGLYRYISRTCSGDYPADVKNDLVAKIRREVRAMQADSPDLAPAATLMTTVVHPDLVAFVEKADQDCPEDDRNA